MPQRRVLHRKVNEILFVAKQVQTNVLHILKVQSLIHLLPFTADLASVRLTAGFAAQK